MNTKTLTTISNAILPIFVVLILVAALIKKTDVYQDFTDGARKGIGITFKTLPYIIGMMFAVEIFRAAGCFDILTKVLNPIFSPLGIPPELLPLLVMRPFSGSGGLGVLAGLINTYGPDSYIARVASIYYGSSETLFYVISLYFGSVGVSKTRYTVPIGLLADYIGLVIACLLCR